MILNQVNINGRVVVFDELNCDREEIDPAKHQGSASVIESGGRHYKLVILPWEDGTIEIQQKSSWLGREAQKGGHANFGYGGYYTGYIWAGGKRRRLKDFWKLFPNKEHHFDQQGHRAEALARIEAAVHARLNAPVTKGDGGWYIFTDKENAA